MGSLSWASSALAAVLFFGGVAHAQVALPELHLDSPCAPSVLQHRRGASSIEDTPAIWFQRDVATCLLGRLQVLPLYVERVRLLEQRLVLSRERDALRVREVDLAVQESDAAQEALDAAVRRTRRAERALGRWYRSPALWIAVGAVLTAGLEALSIWAVRELAN